MPNKLCSSTITSRVLPDDCRAARGGPAAWRIGLPLPSSYRHSATHPEHDSSNSWHNETPCRGVQGDGYKIWYQMERLMQCILGINIAHRRVTTNGCHFAVSTHVASTVAGNIWCMSYNWGADAFSTNYYLVWQRRSISGLWKLGLYLDHTVILMLYSSVILSFVYILVSSITCTFYSITRAVFVPRFYLTAQWLHWLRAAPGLPLRDCCITDDHVLMEHFSGIHLRHSLYSYCIISCRRR